MLYWLFRSFFYKYQVPELLRSRGILVLFAGYLALFLPFISIQRFTLLYHYFPALLFAIMIFSVFFETLLMKLPKDIRLASYAAVLALVVISFIYFLPLSLGIPISQEQVADRLWLPSWREAW